MAGYSVRRARHPPALGNQVRRGSGAPLDLDALSFTELNPVRKQIADAVVDLAGDLDASVKALGLGKTQLAEVDRNADLWLSPPALPSSATPACSTTPSTTDH